MSLPHQVADSTLQDLVQPIVKKRSQDEEQTGQDDEETVAKKTPLMDKESPQETVKTDAEPSPATKTPSKRPSPPERETPQKHAKIVFGKQLHQKAESCKVCGNPRDEFFRGGCCANCLTSCRKIFKHQRIEEILAKDDHLEKIRDMSKGLDPPQHKAVEPRCKCDCREMAGLVKQMGKLVSRLEKLGGGLGNQ